MGIAKRRRTSYQCTFGLPACCTQGDNDDTTTLESERERRGTVMDLYPAAGVSVIIGRRKEVGKIPLESPRRHRRACAVSASGRLDKYSYFDEFTAEFTPA